MRVRLKDALQGRTKADKTMNLLGCDRAFFKRWIAYQFEEHMSWDNYGSYWHMDHVIPCASFDLSLAEEQKICFNWRNIRPAEKHDNLTKSDKLDENLIHKQQCLVQEFILNEGKNFQGLDNPQ